MVHPLDQPYAICTASPGHKLAWDIGGGVVQYWKPFPDGSRGAYEVRLDHYDFVKGAARENVRVYDWQCDRFFSMDAGAVMDAAANGTRAVVLTPID